MLPSLLNSNFNHGTSRGNQAEPLECMDKLGNKATGDTKIYTDRNTGNLWGAKLQKYKKNTRTTQEKSKNEGNNHNKNRNN